MVICPEYRGSTGYGEKHYKEIDYGGYEVDEVMSAVDYLKTLNYVDQDRLGIMGWSHGGYITLFSVFRDKAPFKAAAAIVPVTNLVTAFRTRARVTRPTSRRRSACSVCRSRSAISTSSAHRTKIYVDPPPGAAGGGRTFSRRVNRETLERDDSPEQRDSWNRVWTFFDWHLRPYVDGSKPSTSATKASPRRAVPPAHLHLGVHLPRSGAGIRQQSRVAQGAANDVCNHLVTGGRTVPVQAVEECLLVRNRAECRQGVDISDLVPAAPLREPHLRIKGRVRPRPLLRNEQNDQSCARTCT